jgi:epoxyqueuosine reductase
MPSGPIAADDVKALAAVAGFDLCGIAPVDSFPELDLLKRWLAREFHGDMQYLERNADRRSDVRAIVPSARSVIMLATVYNSDRPYSTDVQDAARGAVARYAWGDDYHAVIDGRMKTLVDRLEQVNGPFVHKAYVDTGPVQERLYARYAGLGWIGKNTCLINQDLGSWLFLSAIITDLPLEPDTPALDHCGRCTLCIDACPTGALVAPRELDARRCLSYLTIEIKGAIPETHRTALGVQAYGCDICQDVCPWNSKAAISLDASWQPREGLEHPRLLDLWVRTDDGLRSLLKGSAMKRAGVRRLRRNLAITLANTGDPAAADALESCGEATAQDPLVQEHVAWAVERLRG